MTPTTSSQHRHNAEKRENRETQEEEEEEEEELFQVPALRHYITTTFHRGPLCRADV